DTPGLPGYAYNPVTVNNFSYDMLQIAAPTLTDVGRAVEWRLGSSTKAVLVSDRNAGLSNFDSQVQSIWTASGGPAPVGGVWEGTVGYGDSHIEFSKPHIIGETQYSGTKQTQDNLFVAV